MRLRKRDLTSIVVERSPDLCKGAACSARRYPFGAGHRNGAS
jgi:hypothetical protein